MGGIWSFWWWVQSEHDFEGWSEKIKWTCSAFPFKKQFFRRHTDRNLNDLKFYSHVSFRSVRSSSRARHFSLQITTTWTTSICAGTPSVWWDGIYCLWDWWKITRVFPPSIRKGNVALILCGTVRNLTLPWAVACFCLGSGEWDQARGHMKGSLCQAAKMFSLSLMKTRTHEQTWEHACHTLYKH